MGFVRLACAAAISVIGCSAQSIVNYQFVGQQAISATQFYKTYRADVVNHGPALGRVTAVASTMDPYALRVVPTQNSLSFTDVPANSQVTSANTFTVLVDQTVTPDFSKLQWAFQSG